MADDPHDVTWSPATTAVTAGRPAREPGAPVSPPVVLTSTFVSQGVPEAGVPAYARAAHPGWEAFEEAVGRLEGAPDGATAFASGMAAVFAVLERVPLGGVVVVPRAAYNTTLELAEDLERSGRVRLRSVDLTDLAAVAAAVEGAAMLWVESPTNPLLEVADVAACAAAARATGALVVVDSTFATPLVQTPLALGAHVVVHSATKYLSGHSDLLMGVAVAADPALVGALRRHRRIHGSGPGPFETWLALRGLRTLALRVERSQATASVLAGRLTGHPALSRVRYPGFGSIVSVEVAGGPDVADAVVAAVRLWVPATSLGGVESMVERRRRHANEPVAVPESLLRLSVGIEDVEDLWRDLARALDAAV